MEAMLADSGFVGSRVLRRGHHARSIVRESGRIARLRPGLVNRLRVALAPLIGLYADVVATFVPGGGEELVMVAFAPETHDHA
jgi:hypothetical protein